MSKFEVTELFVTIENAIKASTNKDQLSAPIDINSQMGSPKEWDSLSFVAVFVAVSEKLAVEVDDDDAIHFTSVSKIIEFLEDVM